MAQQVLYPRTVTISRAPTIAGSGDIGYRAPSQAAEVVVLSDLQANIDIQARGPDPLAHVPTDAVGRLICRIYIPMQLVTPGAIHRGDTATDDLGRRYNCNEAHFGQIDVMIEAELLRA